VPVPLVLPVLPVEPVVLVEDVEPLPDVLLPPPQPAAASIAALRTRITGNFILPSPYDMLRTVFRISTDDAICLGSATRGKILNFEAFSDCVREAECDQNRDFLKTTRHSNKPQTLLQGHPCRTALRKNIVQNY
jgi:hypothetical protein